MSRDRNRFRKADALHAAGRLEQAVASYRVALAFEPDFADGWFGIGCAQLKLRAFGAAASSLERASALAPGFARAVFNHGCARFELGQVERAVSLLERAASLDPSLANEARAAIACIIPGSAAADNAVIRAVRQSWAEFTARGLPRVQPRRAAGGKLRIGYVSAFFGDSNWMKPVFALINRHNRDRFAVFMFSDGKPPSGDSGYRDRDEDVICDMRGVDNARAAALIGDLGIDVLVDLNGYSHPERLPMLMRKPAPILVGWFNMYATTGIDAYDWIVGDPVVARPGEDRYFCERVHRLPGTYLAFEVAYPVPDVSPAPSARNGTGMLTFGCLGSQYKLTDVTVDAWGAILRRSNARLFLKNAALSDPSTREALRTGLGARGIDGDRLAMDGRSGHFDFLDAYRHVDVALDTFPYNGGTTTTEALWQGVPVLAIDGDRWAARTSASLLRAAGLDDWVVPDPDEYVRRAVSIANDRQAAEWLGPLRSGLRARLRRSAACDADGLCARMEEFYRGIGGKALVR